MQLNVFEESEKRQQQCFKQMIEVKHKNDIAEEEKDTQFFLWNYPKFSPNNIFLQKRFCFKFTA